MDLTEDKQKLFDYLQTQHLMSLATSGDSLWAASVYFAVDQDFNIYFVTDPKTEHAKNFLKNPLVCGTITNSHQLNSDDKFGVQFRGTVEQVTGLESLKKAIELWNRINPGVEKWVNIKNIQAQKINSRVFKIKTEVIKIFSTSGDNENTQVFNF